MANDSSKTALIVLLIGAAGVGAYFLVKSLQKTTNGVNPPPEQTGVVVQYADPRDQPTATGVHNFLNQEGFVSQLVNSPILNPANFGAITNFVIVGGECVNPVFRSLVVSNPFRPLVTNYDDCCVNNLGCQRSAFLPNDDSVVLQVGRDNVNRKFIGLAGFSAVGTANTLIEFQNQVNASGALPNVSVIR